MSNEKFNKEKTNIIKEHTEVYDSFERYEIIQGIRYDLLPSPGIIHQVIVTQLWQALNQTCYSAGIVIVAPMDVHLDEHNTIQPDIIFILNESLHIVVNQRIEGSPDLLVEILSPSTGKHDRSRKMLLYETFGVKEYWIVDPMHYTIEQYILDKQIYTRKAIYGEGDTITSDMLACVNIDVSQLFLSAKRFVV